MTELRLVIFDVDGTLVDSQAEIVGAMSEAFAAENMKTPDRAAILSIVGLSLPQAFAALCPGHDVSTQARLAGHYKAAFRDHATALDHTKSPLFDGALEALHRLQGQDHTVLAVATGKSKRGLDRLIGQHGLTGMFVSQQVADFHPSKPHPSMLLAALAETGIAATRAVMIGDTTYDMDMARAAKVATIGVGWGYHAPALLRADRTIADFAELDAAIDALTGEPA